MSVIIKARLLWVLPLIVLGSWLAVRTLGASTLVPAAGVARPDSAAEVKDAALAHYIAGLAAQARRQ